MDNKNLRHKIPAVISSKEIYKNPWLRVREDQFLDALGNKLTYGIVEVRDGVVIVALNSQLEIYLVREYRPAIGQYSLEVVNGGIEKDENPILAAQRELAEEARVQSTLWTELGYVESGTAIVKCRMDLFLAQEVEDTIDYIDPNTSEIEVVKVPFAIALQYVANGTIVHAPSIVAILKAGQLLAL